MAGELRCEKNQAKIWRKSFLSAQRERCPCSEIPHLLDLKYGGSVCAVASSHSQARASQYHIRPNQTQTLSLMSQGKVPVYVVF